MVTKKEKGALTLEATLVFPIYIVAIMTIVSFLNIFYTQAVMQQALNHTATLISQYSYAIGKADDGKGLDFFIGAEKEQDNIKNDMKKVGDSAQVALGSIAGGISISELPTVTGNLGTFAGNIASLISDVQGLNKEKIASVIVKALIGDVNE